MFLLFTAEGHSIGQKTVKNRKIMQDDLQGSLELVFGHNVADCVRWRRYHLSIY